MEIVCPVCESKLDANESVCSLCGFKLLGDTQSFQPITDEVLSCDQENESAHCQLRIVRGPGVNTAYPLEGNTIHIGRNPSCNIFLNDMTVSRSHAYLKQENNTYRIVDNNSFNGIWLNGNSIKSALLKPKDQIQIGVFRFVYENQQ